MGDSVNLLTTHALEYRLHHAVVARVAVMIGTLEQVAALAQERVVDTPAVHSDALEPRVGRSFVDAGVKGVKRTPRRVAKLLDHVRVDHGGLDARVSQVLLDLPDVHAVEQ